MSRRFVSSLCLLSTLGAIGCSSGDLTSTESGEVGDPGSDPRAERWAGTIPVSADDPDGEEVEVVFLAVRILSDDGSVVSDHRQGELTLHAWQRAARPWTHTDDAFLYHEQAWSNPLDGGATENGYRVVRKPNRQPTPPRRTRASEPALGDYVKEAMEGKDVVPVALQLNDYPDWDIPLVPSSVFLSDEDRQRGLTQRKEAIERRQAEFAHRAAPILQELERSGAKVHGLDWGSGWINATVAPDTLAELATRTDLFRIEAAFGSAQSQQVEPGFVEDLAQPTPGAWMIGESRMAQRLDADRFVSFGHQGEIGNATRHAKGDVVVGVIEVGALEDEGCYLTDGPGCSSFSRVKEKYNCAGTTPGSRCATTSNLPDSDGPTSVIACTPGSAGDATCKGLDPNYTGAHCVCLNPPTCTSGRCDCLPEVDGSCARHGTQVTSIILADYSGGQADGINVGDDACGGAGCTHSPSVKRRATGMAPEAGLVFWGNQATCVDGTGYDPCREDALNHSFTLAVSQDVDVINASWRWLETATSCNPLATRPFMTSAENAYNDGIFVVAAAGNLASLTTCNIGSPAVLPKVFAVNGMPTAQPAGTACGYDYNQCVVLAGSAARGGADLVVPGAVADNNAHSAIALTAPTGLRYNTGELGDYGVVNDGTPPNLNVGGTSGAAAIVSGLAADVKSLYLARGDTWINSPGRLFTVMLAMGDRHFDATTTQRATGSDPLYGLGRVRLRRFGVAGGGAGDAAAGWTWNETVPGVTSTAPISRRPFPPLPPGTSMVKCVLAQEETMSGKVQPTVSNIDLEVEIQPAVSGACTGTATPDFELTDASFDTKSMVAITSSNTPLAGKCVNVVTTPTSIDGASATFHLMCYASGVLDDNRLADADGDGVADVDETMLGSCVNGTEPGCSGFCAQVPQPTPVPAGCGANGCAQLAAEKGESCLTCPTDCGPCPKAIDSDCDNALDDEELVLFTNPKVADTDADGSNDNVDSVTNAAWAGGSCTTRAFTDWTGLTGPHSTGDATAGSAGRRPAATFASADAVQVKFCSDPGCGTVVTTANAGAGATSAAPTADLPRGLNFAHAAVKKDGEIACGASSRQQFFVAPQGVASASYRQTCAVTAGGAAKCWGFQSASGQLGNGLTTSSASPVQVSGLTSGIDSVSAGYNHSCVATTGGQAKCWGYNSWGQIGNGKSGDKNDSPTPSTLSLTGVRSVAAGYVNSCAVVGSTNAAKCWGFNQEGQVGDGSTAQRKSPVDVRTTGTTGPVLTDVAAIAASDGHHCALMLNGGVKCWGRGSTGEMGNGTTNLINPNPVNVTGLTSGVVQLAPAFGSMCALTAKGAVKCWGRNSHGQLGDGTNTNRSVPVDVVGLGSGVASLRTGGIHGGHMCALLHTGAVKCWGSNPKGAFGNGTQIGSYTPVDGPSSLPGTVTQAWLLVGGGGAQGTQTGHTCAVRSTGLYCWGSNEDDAAPTRPAGQLGIGSFTPGFTTAPTTAVSGL